jgi:septal ring factor EnvC (AmiA/AmiB activator)
LLVVPLLHISPTSADTDREAQLARVRTRLQSVQTELNATKVQRNAVREEVNALERKIGVLLNEQRATDKRLQAEEQKLKALHEQAAQAQRHLETQRDGLARQVRAQYAAGRQEYLKLLLNQHDPAAASRTLAYYGYLHRARLARIEGIETALAEQRAVERRVAAKQQELLALRESQRTRKTELEASRARRGELLASLDRRVVAQSQELEQLREDQARLARLLDEIKTVYADVPFPSDIKGAFGTLKGKLPLPAKGRVLAKFGDPKPVGNMRWRGLFVSAEEGAPVRALSPGRVAYADWLRGFGLLLILEHGDGYMTLYGHNQSLSKQAGERVEAGEVVARVGSTGDAPQPGLYFEVRHHGEPRDPLLWCRAR